LNITAINGIPAEEFNERQAKWQAACRTMNLKPEMFNLEKLIKTLAGQTWMRQCEIIPGYMPPNPHKDTRPACIVRYRDPRRGPVAAGERDGYTYLRYSGGPLQGTFWDFYGDDFHSPELALVMLATSTPPNRCEFNFFAH
jgi:hypothetical protein